MMNEPRTSLPDDAIPTPEQIKFARTTLGRTQEGMAKLVGTSTASWGRWERDAKIVPLKIFREKLVKLYNYAIKFDKNQDAKNA